MYLAVHLDADGFFELRKRKSTESEAYEEDIAVIHTGDPGDEEALNEELRLLARGAEPPAPEPEQRGLF